MFILTDRHDRRCHRHRRRWFPAFAGKTPQGFHHGLLAALEGRGENVPCLL
jgi:hypothetical protein